MNIHILVLVIAIILFGLLAFKQMSALILAPLVTSFVIICSGMPILDSLKNLFMPAAAEYVTSYFLVFFVGALFGAVYQYTGAAESIARAIASLCHGKFVAPIIMIITGLLTFGGVSGFVVFFVIYPIALNLFKEANLTRRLIPAAISAGCWTWSMSGPGSPSVQNVIAMDSLGTPSTAVCVNSIIMSLLFRSSPEDVKLLLIDPKVVELAEYNGIPHLLMPVVTEPRKAAGALGSAVQEMERRYRLFAENNVRDIKSFNKLAAEQPELEKMPYIAIIIDELADLMMVVGKDVEDSICRIAQKARAAGMHLIVATQRPSVDVITGLIKANIPSRIAFAVSSQVDSRTILDGAGAEKLLGQGDMLFMPVGAPKPTRIQGTFVRDEEISRVLDFIKSSATVQYDEAMIEAMEKHAIQDGKKGGGGADAEEDAGSDPMFKQAVDVVIDAGQASTSLLQRRCKLGYARAARIMDEMEQKSIIGPYEGAKPRAVLISRQQWLEMQINQPEE